MMPFKDENPTYRKPIVTWVLIGLNIFVFVFLQGMANPGAEEVDFTLEWAAIPCEITSGEPLTLDEITATFERGEREACGVDLPDVPGNEPYLPNKFILSAAIFSMFLHADFMHLGGNMLYLWIFGNNIEDRLGTIKYLLFYVIGGIFAAAAHILPQPDSTIPVVGASGAVAAVMGAYVVWYPDAPVRTFVMLFLKDFKAKWVLAFWFVSQFFIGSGSGVAWLAHVGGFVFGAVVAFAIRSSRPLQKLSLTPDYRDVEHWDNTGGIGRGPYDVATRIGRTPPPPRPQDRRF